MAAKKQGPGLGQAYGVKIGTEVNHKGEAAGKITTIRSGSRDEVEQKAKEAASQGKVAEVFGTDPKSGRNTGTVAIHMNKETEKTATALRLSAAAEKNPAWTGQALKAHQEAAEAHAQAGNAAKAEEHRSAAHAMSADKIEGSRGDIKRDEHGRFEAK